MPIKLGVLKMKFVHPRTKKPQTVLLDDRKIAIYNAGMKIIAETAKELAMSWSYDSHEGVTDDRTFAGSWEIEYDRGSQGQILTVEIWNTLGESGGGEHECGASTEELWQQMITGRERTLRPDAGRAFKNVATSRFRTKRINVKAGVIKYIGAIPELNPQQRAQDFLNEENERLIIQLWESRWGSERAGGRPRALVRALPFLYTSYYGKKSGYDTQASTGMAMNTKAFGTYGGRYRKDVQYKFSK